MTAAPPLSLRPVVFEDWPLLLEWANRPDSLAAKLKTRGPIGAETHKAWLTRFLDGGEGRIFVLSMDDEPVGQIRFQAEAPGLFAIDVYVAAERRDGGVARRALQEGMNRVVAERGAARFRARVRAENERSHRLFRRLGFVERARADDHATYERHVEAVR